ncbi:MAG: sigma-70 family RNA polymerase sigma factor [Solirubrobacteraceae bacterium]
MTATSGTEPGRRVEHDFEQYRVVLTRRCTRMLGSRSEAEDAVQETLLRAWRHHERFQGRCRLDSWLYRIATNVCVDMLNARSKRAEPVDPASLQSAPLEGAADTDPAEQTLTDEAFRLALVVAIDRLPARQRAVLTLREVFGWRTSEVAELLGISVAAVNSLLQRARASLEPDRTHTRGPSPASVADSRQELLASFLAAFESYHVDLHRQLTADSA